jgi:hypothetical protein
MLLAAPDTSLAATGDELAPIIPAQPNTAAQVLPPPAAATPDPIQQTPPQAPQATIGAQTGQPQAATPTVTIHGTGGTKTRPATEPWLIFAILVCSLLLLLLLLFSLVRWRSWDPAWLRSARHACSEASWRVGNSWSEFADWVRIGR